MKIKLFYFSFLILISCGTSKSLNSKPIFRYVNLYTYGKFELGDNIQKINPTVVLQMNPQKLAV